MVGGHPVDDYETAVEQIETESYWRVLREPAIPIILTALVVHIARRNGADIAIFVFAAAAILVDRRWQRDPTPSETLRAALDTLGARVLLLASCVYAVVLALFPRDGWVSVVGLSIPGLVALTLLLRKPDSPLLTGLEAPASPGAAWRWWPVLGVTMCLWELASFLQQPDSQTDSFTHPTLSSVVDPLLAEPVLRSVVVVCWLLVGVWLVCGIVSGPRRAQRSTSQ
jgi:hypothetical protein